MKIQADLAGLSVQDFMGVIMVAAVKTLENSTEIQFSVNQPDEGITLPLRTYIKAKEITLTRQRNIERAIRNQEWMQKRTQPMRQFINEFGQIYPNAVPEGRTPFVPAEFVGMPGYNWTEKVLPPKADTVVNKEYLLEKLAQLEARRVPYQKFSQQAQNKLERKIESTKKRLHKWL